MKPISDWDRWIRSVVQARGQGEERTYRCVRCRDTGFCLSRKPGPSGTEVNVATVCGCEEGDARQAAHVRRMQEQAAGPRRRRRQLVEPEEPDTRYGD